MRAPSARRIVTEYKRKRAGASRDTGRNSAIANQTIDGSGSEPMAVLIHVISAIFVTELIYCHDNHRLGKRRSIIYW